MSKNSFVNKRIYKRHVTYAVLLTLIITLPTLFFAGYYIAQASYPSGATPVFEHPITEASYLIWRDGSTYYAKNGSIGEVTSGTNFTEVTTNAFGSGEVTVFLKIGYYYMDSTLWLPSNSKLIGEDRFQTVLYLNDNSNTHMLRSTDTENITISTLTLDGNYAGQGAFDSRGISYVNVNNSIIENMEFYHQRNDVIRLTNYDGTTHPHCNDITIQNFHVADIYPDGEEVIDTTSTPLGTSAATNIVIRNGLIENAHFGINMGDAQNSRVESVTVRGGGNAFETESNSLTDTVTFKNCYAIGVDEAYSTTTFYIGTNATHVTIENCYAIDSLWGFAIGPDAQYNTISNSYAINTTEHDGFQLAQTYYNTLMGNHAINNGNGNDYGFYLWQSATNNTFIGNYALGLNLTNQLRGFKEENSNCDFNIYIGSTSEGHPSADDLLGANNIEEHNFFQT